jgi:hypothetical protein
MTTATLESSIDSLRDAVAARMAATDPNDPKMQGYRLDQGDPEPVASCCEGTRTRGDSLLKSEVHPTSQAYFDLLDRMKSLHSSKSRDYGSEHDPLANIRNGALFVGIEPWKGAMVRLSDKVTRLATFNRTGTLTHEGVEDNLMDLASYALLALLLHREEQGR